MTETLRDKLIRCGWVTNFNADTLVKLIERHYAALAQPEPQGPTDEELPPRVGHILRLAEIIREVDGNHKLGAAALAEAILSHSASRWNPAIEPVPVTERLPEPEDCDAGGRCWWWDDDDDMWRLHEHRPRLLCWTHWLPHHALPVPQQEAE